MEIRKLMLRMSVFLSLLPFAVCRAETVTTESESATESAMVQNLHENAEMPKPPSNKIKFKAKISMKVQNKINPQDEDVVNSRYRLEPQIVGKDLYYGFRQDVKQEWANNRDEWMPKNMRNFIGVNDMALNKNLKVTPRFEFWLPMAKTETYRWSPGLALKWKFIGDAFQGELENNIHFPQYQQELSESDRLNFVCFNELEFYYRRIENLLIGFTFKIVEERAFDGARDVEYDWSQELIWQFHPMVNFEVGHEVSKKIDSQNRRIEMTSNEFSKLYAQLELKY